MFKFDLLENEEVVNIYRQSETVLFKPVLIIFILIYFPWFFLLKYELAATFARLLFFWTILVLIYAVRKYLIWALNSYLLTNKRLISINYTGLFNKQVTESPLNGILNVSFSTTGFWASLLGFGSVYVQVAGMPEPMVLKNVSSPSEIKNVLWKIHGPIGKMPK